MFAAAWVLARLCGASLARAARTALSSFATEGRMSKPTKAACAMLAAAGCLDPGLMEVEPWPTGPPDPSRHAALTARVDGPTGHLGTGQDALEVARAYARGARPFPATFLLPVLPVTPEPPFDDAPCEAGGLASVAGGGDVTEAGWIVVRTERCCQREIQKDGTPLDEWCLDGVDEEAWNGEARCLSSTGTDGTEVLECDGLGRQIGRASCRERV